MSDNQINHLKQRGWRVTPQRRAVVAALEGGEGAHLTAEDILERARRLVPEISLATVYNSLRELTELGEVVPLTTGTGATRYEPASTTHHHLTCVSCGEILDVDLQDVDRLRLRDEHGYKLSAMSVTFRGLCAVCTAARGSDASA